MQGGFIVLTGSVPIKNFLHATLVPTANIFVFADLKVCHHSVRLDQIFCCCEQHRAAYACCAAHRGKQTSRNVC